MRRDLKATKGVGVANATVFDVLRPEFNHTLSNDTFTLSRQRSDKLLELHPNIESSIKFKREFYHLLASYNKFTHNLKCYRNKHPTKAVSSLQIPGTCNQCNASLINYNCTLHCSTILINITLHFKKLLHLIKNHTYIFLYIHIYVQIGTNLGEFLLNFTFWNVTPVLLPIPVAARSKA
jgi:hypothetical protein